MHDSILILFCTLYTAEDFTKCTGVKMGLTDICSKLTEMKARGGCCASNSDGTGTVSAVGETSKEEFCGYCFTGKPATLIEEVMLEGIGCMHVYYLYIIIIIMYMYTPCTYYKL